MEEGGSLIRSRHFSLGEGFERRVIL
jgi:hypothetical protein